LIKSEFSQSIETGEYISQSRQRKNERGIWQRRFWEHLIRNDEDYSHRFDYIHYNPVKHHWVKRVRDWPYSSFHQYVKQGIYTSNWGSDMNLNDININDVE
jgi:putative transposase